MLVICLFIVHILAYLLIAIFEHKKQKFLSPIFILSLSWMISYHLEGIYFYLYPELIYSHVEKLIPYHESMYSDSDFIKIMFIVDCLLIAWVLLSRVISIFLEKISFKSNFLIDQTFQNESGWKLIALEFFIVIICYILRVKLRLFSPVGFDPIVKIPGIFVMMTLFLPYLIISKRMFIVTSGGFSNKIVVSAIAISAIYGVLNFSEGWKGGIFFSSVLFVWCLLLHWKKMKLSQRTCLIFGIVVASVMLFYSFLYVQNVRILLRNNVSPFQVYTSILNVKNVVKNQNIGNDKSKINLIINRITGINNALIVIKNFKKEKFTIIRKIRNNEETPSYYFSHVINPVPKEIFGIMHTGLVGTFLMITPASIVIMLLIYISLFDISYYFFNVSFLKHIYFCSVFVFFQSFAMGGLGGDFLLDVKYIVGFLITVLLMEITYFKFLRKSTIVL